MPHSRFRSSVRLVAFGAALVFALPLAAQERRVIVGGQGASVISLSSLALHDSTIRRLIETNLPGAFADDADAHQVTLVLDANGEYVSGKVAKATVLTPAVVAGSGENVFITGDSLAGGRVTIRRIGTETSGSGSGATAFVVGSTDGAMAAGGGHGVFGSGYDASEVSSVGIRRFTAGDLARGPVIVTVVRLK